MNKEINLFSLKNKVAVVTGGRGILGTKFCEGLQQSGAKVAVIDITETRDTQPSEGIYHYTCDITSEKSVKECVNKIFKDLGSIDILLNNAATKTSNIKDFFLPIEEYKLETWKEVMSVNIDAMFLMAKHVGKIMKKQDSGGSIIQTSSIYGILGPDPRIYEGSSYMGVEINTPAVYSASKAAVVGFSKWLSTNWAKNNIRVNCIVPGGIESGQNNEFINNYSKKVPMGRMGQAKELIPTVVYLASDASSYITGQVLKIDGGYSSW